LFATITPSAASAALHLFRSPVFEIPPSIIRLGPTPTRVIASTAKMHRAYYDAVPGHDGRVVEIVLRKRQIVFASQ
jgi:hypothetical protein